MATKSKKPARKPSTKKHAPRRKVEKKTIAAPTAADWTIASSAPDRQPPVVIIGQARSDDVVIDSVMDILDVVDMALSSSEAWPKGTEDEIYAVRGALAQIGRMLKPMSNRSSTATPHL